MYFHYQDKELHWQNSNLKKISRVIEDHLRQTYQYSGPYFLYHENILKERLGLFEDNFPDSDFFYSVKSLSNVHILKQIAGYERFGVDVVSGGEISRALHAGFLGRRIVYAGVGKTEDEIKLGLNHQLKSFHVESISEIKQIERIAGQLKTTGPVTLRLNPDIPVDTHKYIVTGVEESKFGINAGELNEAIRIIKDSKHLALTGLQIHLGSQILDPQVYLKGLDFLYGHAKNMEQELSSRIDYLSLGGGFGIDYTSLLNDHPAKEFPVSDFGKSLKTKISEKEDFHWKVDFEPGRFISAQAGLLMAHVLYLKPRNDYTIAITDAGMSELIRPALYDATHGILPVEAASEGDNSYDIVGPICESGDFFAKKISLPTLSEGGKIIIAHAGAYGSVMSSNYNSRPHVPEVLIRGDDFQIIRRPQTREDIFSMEI